jgi:hypothetical protein
MQGGKNWILPKETNENRFLHTLIGWKSGKTTYVSLWDRMEGACLWTQIKRAKVKTLFRRGKIALHAISLPELAVCKTVDLFLEGQNRFL